MGTKRPLTSTTSLSATVLLLVATLSVASAFQNNAYTSKGSLSMYGSRSRSTTPTSLSLVTSRQQQQTQKQSSKTSTRLQFSDDASVASSSNTAIESRWWNKLFMSPTSNDSSATSTSSTTSENEEQDNVDAYLEFLDRRYRRLHCDDKEEKEQQQQATQAQAEAQTKQQESKKAKSFSAMDWLMNGNSNSNVVASTREQQEDALYVLGVAGLASVKLLQKHHLPTSTSTSTSTSTTSSSSPSVQSKKVATLSASTIEKVVELKEQIDDAIEVNEDESTTLKEMKNQINYFLVNNLLLPIVRVIYVVQRQKQLLVQMIQQRVKALAMRAANGVVQTFSKGPRSVLNSLLSVGGGRRNIFRTMAIGYATMLVFRPLLHAAFAEGLGFDPLIQ